MTIVWVRVDFGLIIDLYHPEDMYLLQRHFHWAIQKLIEFNDKTCIFNIYISAKLTFSCTAVEKNGW